MEEGNTVQVRRKNCPACDKKCEKCSCVGHFKKVCKTNPRDTKADTKNGKNNNESADGIEKHLLEISMDGDGHDHLESLVGEHHLDTNRGGHAIVESPAPSQESVSHLVRSSQGKLRSEKRRVLRHLRYDAPAGKYVSTWKDKRMKNLQVGITVDREQYQELAGVMAPGEDCQHPVAKEPGVADTGASVCCSGTDMVHAMGVSRTDLLETDVCLYAAKRKKLNIIGVLPVLVSSRRVGTGELVETKQLLYIVEELGKFYLSREPSQTLGSNLSCFPEVLAQQLSMIEYAEEIMATIAELETKALCGCQVRSAPPEAITMPCPATEENRGRLKEFLVSSFKSSTFNICEHQPLPPMHGPPLEFKLKEGGWSPLPSTHLPRCLRTGMIK